MTSTARPGTIDEWNRADNVGRVLLENGERLRLGGSACKGFQPMSGMRVRVLEVGPHPLGGQKALVVELAEDTASYDARVQSGEEEPSDQTAAANARTLGWFVVLLDSAPGAGRAGARALVESTEISRIGARVDLGPARTVGLERFDFPFYVGRSPLFAAVPHRGFVAVSGGLVDFERNARLMRGASAPDPWAAAGSMRTLLRVVTAFARVGTHVFRPVSGGVAPKQVFLDDIGDLDDLSNRPTDAIIDVVPAEGGMRTMGMAMCGLPDVFARGEGHPEALRDAAHGMAQANAEPNAGDHFESGDREYRVVALRGDDLLEIARTR